MTLEAHDVEEALLMAAPLASLICFHDTSKYEDIDQAYRHNDAIGAIFDPTAYMRGMSQREKNQRMLGAILTAQKKLREAGVCP